MKSLLYFNVKTDGNDDSMMKTAPCFSNNRQKPEKPPVSTRTFDLRPSWDRLRPLWLWMDDLFFNIQFIYFFFRCVTAPKLVTMET